MSAHLQGAESYWKGLIGAKEPESLPPPAMVGFARLGQA
jgi:hypothetical protein